MKNSNLRKLLYLLQLEEYQTSRYFSWLKTYPIEKLEEKKGKLCWTTRIILTMIFSLLLAPFWGEKKAIGIINNILSYNFRFGGELIVFLAKIKLKFFPDSIRIVVTGSYGKTTFKEMLAYVLEEKYSVFKTPGNINTILGIAINVLKNLKKSHQILIIEAGAYQKGEIRKICDLIKPSFGIITIIGWMHLERFGRIDEIRKAKFEIGDFMKNKNNFFYPQKNHQLIDFEKTIFTIGQRLSIPNKIIEKRLKTFNPPPHRLITQIVNKNLLILDDTYNSNPLGFEKALVKLKDCRGYQKVIVTPGMIELRDKQFTLNEEVSFKATKTADILMIVGETNRKALVSGANQANKKRLKIILINKNENFQEKLKPHLRPPTVILLENDLPDHYF